MKIKKNLSKETFFHYLFILEEGIFFWKDMWEHNRKEKIDSPFFKNEISNCTNYNSLCELYFNLNKEIDCWECEKEFCPLYISFSLLWRHCKYLTRKGNKKDIFSKEFKHPLIRNYIVHKIYKIHVKLYYKYLHYYKGKI